MSEVTVNVATTTVAENLAPPAAKPRPSPSAGTAHNSSGDLALSGDSSPSGGAAAASASQSASPAAALAAVSHVSYYRERLNWRIHLLFTRNMHDQCVAAIEQQLAVTNGLSEYALFVKGLLKRLQGDLNESLVLFRAAAVISPQSFLNLKHVAKALYLLGRHKQALDIYSQATPPDWEIRHGMGLCYLHLKDHEQAEKYFMAANATEVHEATALQLGKLATLRDDFERALEVYASALDARPDSATLLTSVGLLHLRMGNTFRAFDALQAALQHDPMNTRALVAAGSLLQDHLELDLALRNYRLACGQVPHSPHLWNNMGMCFHSKGQQVAAVAAIGRALFLAPLEWIIALNMGIVFLGSELYASAFLYLSRAINLRPAYPPSYMYLGITLGHLNDPENAVQAYEKALTLEAQGEVHVVRLNYAITLHNYGHYEQAREQYTEFQRLFEELDDEARNVDEQLLTAAAQARRVHAHACKVCR
eukprot:TRINITY_DN5668_c0_g1_i3.p1 TRINITY_DN5668_c0_g1~~TRINITY_DN5668_c0_g1_i3.p1  ORF type:complete len:480 (-),score=95.22 TRINITY_DN5668_c0_g1_i3:50-1489(-)